MGKKVFSAVFLSYNSWLLYVNFKGNWGVCHEENETFVY